MWQRLSGANRAVGVESRAGVYCCALCRGLGRLRVSPWLRAMQSGRAAPAAIPPSVLLSETFVCPRVVFTA